MPRQFMPNPATRFASPLVGFCPIGKFVFSHADALIQKNRLQEKLTDWQVRFVDLDGVVEDGIVREQRHVDAVVEHFNAAGIDALFLPHCNFGTEGAAGMIARRLNAPTLLWGPRDEAPLADGSRLRDTLCGLFATSKVLHKLGVTFSYIENCRTEDILFREEFDRFVRAANVAKIFRRGARIGCVGSRIDFFWTTIINESELLERFNIELLPFDMVEFLRAAKQRVGAHRDAYAREVRELRQQIAIEGMPDDAPLINVLGVRDEMLALGDAHGLDGFSFRNFMSVIDETGAYCSYAGNHVSERFALGIESDVHGAISDLMLRRATLDCQPAWVSEFVIRHPERDDSALLWHDGAPLSFRDPADPLRLGHHWILPTPLSGMDHFRLKPGEMTFARFDGDGGRYQLAIGEGQTTDGPATLNNYAWVEVENWPRWERRLIEGPFIHHLGMTYGRYGKVLEEACRFIPGLTPVRL